jgi:ubiquinone biosynthesis protein COQ4
MKNRGIVSRPIRPFRALRAMRALLADPDDTSQVFLIIRALSGNSFERLYQRVDADPAGHRLLDEKRDLLAVLQDRESLRALPNGTLGREYARFLDRERISPEGLVDASAEEDPPVYLDERARVFGLRLRDMHDLWHVVTGYKRDLFGEAALLAFTYAQTRNHGVGFIVMVALLRQLHDGHREAMRLTWAAWQRGRRAGSFPAADWEALLSQPLDRVRTILKVEDLPSYTPLFSKAAPVH